MRHSGLIRERESAEGLTPAPVALILFVSGVDQGGKEGVFRERKSERESSSKVVKGIVKGDG